MITKQELIKELQQQYDKCTLNSSYLAGFGTCLSRVKELAQQLPDSERGECEGIKTFRQFGDDLFETTFKCSECGNILATHCSHTSGEIICKNFCDNCGSHITRSEKRGGA